MQNMELFCFSAVMIIVDSIIITSELAWKVNEIHMENLFDLISR